MIGVTALPPKAAKVRCAECDLLASPPIVVACDPTVGIGRCSNRKACDLRLLRKLNREKEAKA